MMLLFEQTNAEGQDFKLLWNQLQQGPQQQTKPTTETEAGRDKPRSTTSVSQPPGPLVNGRVLCPPPSWLKQHSAADTLTAKSETSPQQNSSENMNPVTPQKPTKVSMLVCQQLNYLSRL